MNKKETLKKLSVQVKKMLENEERSYMTREYKEEVYMNVMNEAMTMMKRKPEKSVIVSQREVDRAEFEYYYNRWKTETIICSNMNIVFDNNNLRMIEKMGLRAVPFIYEKLKDGYDFVAHALPVIYGESLLENSCRFVGQEKYRQMCIKKIEDEGDVL